MRRLWPEAAELDDIGLRAEYAYPQPLNRPWVRGNFVSSADGAVSIDGRSEGLSSPADKHIFGILRELADVVLAGAGTIRVEGYRGARSSPAAKIRRCERGQRPVPPIGVVTGSCRLDPDSGLFTDTEVAPLIFTTEAAADGPHGQRLASAGGRLEVVGTDQVRPDLLLSALDRLALRRVLCEGGPHLFGELLADDAVDELCLTLSPQLVGGYAGRIVAGPVPAIGRHFDLAGVLLDEHDLLLRYRHRRHPDPG